MGSETAEPIGSFAGGSLAAAERARRRLIATVVLLPFIVALIMAVFAWPAARLAPRDLPLGLAGPEAALAPLEGRLTSGGAFMVRRYDGEAAAREAIRRREVYGAIVVTPNGPTVLTASAASPLVAQLLQSFAGGVVGTPGGAAPPVQTSDVVPADPDDPRMAVFGSALLPLVLAGVLVGAVAAVSGGTGTARIATLFVASLLAALAVLAIVQGWLGALGGNWVINWGVLALIVLAIAATVAGLHALLGQAGIGVASATMVLVGNTTSAITSAPELLPRPLGSLGQLLPPGAGGSLLRSTAFFEGNGASGPLVVLVVWVALGLAVVTLAALRARGTGDAAAAVRGAA